ncbi:MAG: hypothetical protein HN396_18930 [Gemmatimonadales bacterium]|jgi:hypothetical protein|nr:hypothetical protein [Gemmatimonadales bacterium]
MNTLTPSDERALRRIYRQVCLGEASYDDVRAEFPHLGWQFIKQKASDLDLTPKRQWSAREITTLRANYGRLTYAEMAPLLPGRTPHSINLKCHFLGLAASGKGKGPQRRYLRQLARDDRFFDDPNPVASYWAGFLAADGCLYGPPRRVVTMTLQRRDRGVLEQLRTDTRFEGTIKTDSYNRVRLVVSSAGEWLRGLEHNYNLTPRKTFTLTPPTGLGTVNARCYLVGLIDGDGHMRVNRDGRMIFALVGTEEVMNWSREIFAEIEPEHPRSAGVFQAKGENVFRYNVSGARVVKILQTLDEMPCHHLERKWSVPRHYRS